MAGTVYISYFDEIQPAKARALMALCAGVLAEQQPERLYFLFSSSGGSVDAGVALFNFLRALPVPIVMHNAGSVDSIGNVVFLAADERHANPNSTFLLHGINWGFPQGTNLSWAALQETVSRFKADEARMSGIITARTGIAAPQLLQLFREGSSVNLEEAITNGMIQSVVEARVPQGAPFIACNF